MSQAIPKEFSDLLLDLKPFGGTDLGDILTRVTNVLGLDGVRVSNGNRRLASGGNVVGAPSKSLPLRASGAELDAFYSASFGAHEALEALASVLDLTLSSGDRRPPGSHQPLMSPSGPRDRVTETISRDSFIEYLDMELAAAPEVATVIMIGLDSLDTVKETIGHDAGDHVLRETAQRLQATLRSCDVVSRVGLDTFALFCPNLFMEVAGPLATRLQEAIAAPIEWRGSEVRATASAGIAARGRGERTGALLEHAELALIAAKDSGASGIAIYDGVLRSNSEDRRELAAQLVEALAQNQLATALDPIVSLPKGAVVGVEAHVLWNHPTRGQIDRAGFIGLAELIGRVDDVERAVLEFAIQQNVERKQKVRTGFNLSASTLGDPEMIAWIVGRLSGEDHHIIVEVDEETLLNGSALVGKHLGALREVGASIVLDGFGLHSASLRALHAHSFDGVKLHQALLDAGSNARALSIINGMYASAATAGFDIIHTGVDSDMDLRRLIALCDGVGGDGFYAQGKAVRRRVSQASAAA